MRFPARMTRPVLPLVLTCLSTAVVFTHGAGEAWQSPPGNAGAGRRGGGSGSRDRLRGRLRRPADRDYLAPRLHELGAARHRHASPFVAGLHREKSWPVRFNLTVAVLPLTSGPMPPIRSKQFLGAAWTSASA
jgi:hypothetical protein